MDKSFQSCKLLWKPICIVITCKILQLCLSAVAIPTDVGTTVPVITYPAERMLTFTNLSGEELLAISESVVASFFTLSSPVSIYSCSIVLSLAVASGAESGDSAGIQPFNEAASTDDEGGCVVVWLGSLSQPILVTDPLGMIR